MQHDLFVSIFIGGLYAFIAWLICYQIEIRWRPLGRIKCRFGKHKRYTKELGKIIKQYRCTICGKAKEHPHLKIIDGGKKDLGPTFKW